eukprot:XP_788766.1 PREDICTED: STAM-binding protein-like A [Strongylocentrotus purpuratus]
MVMQQDPSIEPGQRVRSLAEHGSNIVVDGNLPIRRYFRSGQEMIKMANIYYEEGNWESAFILYSKYMTIFVEKIRKHPQYKAARPEDLKSAKKNLKSAFPNAEETKKKLREKYAEEHKIWQVQEDERRAEEARQEAMEALRLEEEHARREQEDTARFDEQRRQLEELERHSIDQQQRELDGQKASLMQAKAKQEALDQERKKADALNEQEWQAEGNRRLAGSIATPIAAGGAAGLVAGMGAGMGAGGNLPPPPSYDAVSQGYGIRSPQVLPSSPTQPTAPRPAPTVDRSLKIDRTNKPAQMLGIASSTSNLHGLRDLFIPADTMERFLVLASHNTQRNLETCGILAGKLAHDAFTITHIIVPKQTSTSDSCTALNEEEIFDAVDNNDLITLGWIHTHPSQTAFMSSIDLHTHCPYQIMMPEAIAIVCAPKHQQICFFSLTPDYGITFIANCKEKGFHPHPSQPPIYEEGGHCKVTSQIPPIKIEDLR